MAHITWGTTKTESGDYRCTIFCMDCRKPLIENLTPCEASIIRDEVEHECESEQEAA